MQHIFGASRSSLKLQLYDPTGRLERRLLIQDSSLYSLKNVVVSMFFFYPQSASSQLSLDKEKPSIRGSSVDSTVKPRRVQVLPMTSETSPASQHEQSRDKTECFLQLKKSLLSRKTYWSNRSYAQKLDISSRILFPVTYALYNIAYWYVYLNGIKII